MYIGDLGFLKRDIRCKTGSGKAGEPVQIIRIREDKLVDVVTICNSLIFKVPQSFIEIEVTHDG